MTPAKPCTNPDHPVVADQDQRLPCAWPDCPNGHNHRRYYLPQLPDPNYRATITANPPSPTYPNDIAYDRVPYHINPLLRRTDLLYRWVLHPNPNMLP